MKALIKRPSLMMLLIALFGGIVQGCLDNQKAGNSDLATAGGKVDRVGQFASTVYVKVETMGIKNGPGPTMANVGTLVDMEPFGAPGYAALVMSLQDAFQKDGDYAFLPPLASLSISIYVDDRMTSPVEINNIRINQDMTLDGGLGLLGVGLHVQKRGGDVVDPGIVSKFEQHFLMASPLKNPKSGTDYRNEMTSYLMLAIPKSKLAQDPRLKFAKAIPAEDRPQEYEINQSLAGKGAGDMKLVGFGTTSDASVKAADGSIKTEEVTHRNAATIWALNDGHTGGKKGFTPLRDDIAHDMLVKPFTKEIWEIGGSGLCGSSDGVSYDTGASVMWKKDKSSEYEFLGFGVSTTSISAGFKGKADCKKVKPDDMATIVVSPSKEIYQALASRIHR